MNEPTQRAKIAIVSGGAGGLGRVMTLALLKQGTRVAALDVNEMSLDGLKDKAAQSSLAGGLKCYPVDLGDPERCRQVVDQVVGDFGGLDVLVNNAGIGMLVFGPNYEEQPVKFWQADIDKWFVVFADMLFQWQVQFCGQACLL